MNGLAAIRRLARAGGPVIAIDHRRGALGLRSGLKFIRGLGCNGHSHVEFRRDPRDGVYKLMEINPGIRQWHEPRGGDRGRLPAIAYRDLLGESQAAVTSKDKRKRWAVTLYAGTKPAIPRLPYRDGVFSLTDRVPSIAQTARLVRGLVR